MSLISQPTGGERLPNAYRFQRHSYLMSAASIAGRSPVFTRNDCSGSVPEMSRSLLNIAKRPLPRLTLRGVGLTSKDAVS